MFAVAPLAPRVVLRIPPAATLALVVAIAAASAWTLCNTATAGGGLAANSAAVPDVLGYRAGDAAARVWSALFVHADAMHLVVNLLALALAGACLEQVWGASPTALLFLGAGAASIAFDAGCTGGADRIVGASAGVSALLGACFVRFRERHVRFAYVYFEYLRPRTGSFRISCAAAGLVWAIQQTIGAAWNACTGDGTVAFASHVGGMAVGIAVALLAERITPARTTHPAISQKQPSWRSPS